MLTNNDKEYFELELKQTSKNTESHKDSGGLDALEKVDVPPGFENRVREHEKEYKWVWRIKFFDAEELFAFCHKCDKEVAVNIGYENGHDHIEIIDTYR